MPIDVGVGWELRLEPDVAGTVLRRGGDVDGAMRRRAEQVAERARQLAPSATGTLRDLINVRQSRDAGGRFASGWDVSADAPYAIYVHQGRRAGAKMPPAGPIGAWLEVVELPAEANFPIRRAIAEKGIDANPFLADALRETIR